MTELDKLRIREQAVLRNISDLGSQTGLAEADDGTASDLAKAHDELWEIQKMIKELGG